MADKIVTQYLDSASPQAGIPTRFVDMGDGTWALKWTLGAVNPLDAFGNLLVSLGTGLDFGDDFLAALLGASYPAQKAVVPNNTTTLSTTFPLGVGGTTGPGVFDVTSATFGVENAGSGQTIVGATLSMGDTVGATPIVGKIYTAQSSSQGIPSIANNTAGLLVFPQFDSTGFKTATLTLTFGGATTSVGAINIQAKFSTNSRLVDSAGSARVNLEGQKATYSASVSGLVIAATPTDVVTIAGVAAPTKVHLVRVSVSGRATAVGTLPVGLIRRSTADTGGTSTAPGYVLHDLNDVAPAAVLAAYTANPGALGATPAGYGLFRAASLSVGPVGAGAITSTPIVWEFGRGAGDKHPILPSPARQFALNLFGAAIPAGLVLDVDLTWTEE